MSVFYDQASLVLVPSGYKSGVVYSQKPMTTDGQLSFTRASTATRVNSSGLIASVASGVPRLDYLGSTCPKLLLEPQRSNLMLYSEQFDNAYWTKSNSTITANNVTSPDGTANADLITASGSGSVTHVVNRAITTTSGSVYAFSVFAKKGTTDWIALRHDSGGTFNYFNLATGTKGATCDASAAIENYGNGWYRLTVFHTATGSNGGEVYLATANGTISFAAAGQTLYIYGAQYELGAYATSYIPTTTAAVTRLADAGYKAGVSSLIGQTEGVLYAEVQNTSIGSTSGADNVVVTIEGASFNDVVGILYQPNGTIYGLTIVGGALETLVTANVGVTSAFKKIAFAYKANDFALYVDGVQVGTDTSGTVPTCSNLGLGQYYNGGSISVINSKAVKQALVFKTRLTNDQLAQLTAV